MLKWKKITLIPERSAETKQQLLAYLQETLTLMQSYAAIKTVAFGGASSGQAGFLRNPDVSELTVMCVSTSSTTNMPEEPYLFVHPL
jgi:hypothetical protein